MLDSVARLPVAGIHSWTHVTRARKRLLKLVIQSASQSQIATSDDTSAGLVKILAHRRCLQVNSRGRVWTGLILQLLSARPIKPSDVV